MSASSRVPERAEGTFLHECSGADRLRTEKLIRDRFRRSYGADLHMLMPRLFTMTGTEGQLLCAFGLREASVQRLYMEQYLDRPVEEVISDLIRKPVERSQIIEVGNLAAIPGNARMMIVTLTQYLFHAGFHWVVFTGVAALRAAFTRLGLTPVVLAAADRARLTPADVASWGDYFAASPQVMAGNIRAGYRLLAAAAETGTVSWQ